MGVLTAAFVILGAAGGVAALFATQALDVRDDLLEAKTMLGSLPEAVKTGDTARMQTVGAEGARADDQR